MKKNEEKTYFWRIPLLIIILGIISALLLLINNHLIIHLIGYGFIYTFWLMIFVIMSLIKNGYKLLFNKALKAWPGLFLSYPIFLFLLSINEYSSNYGGTVAYTKFGIEELIKKLIFGSLCLSIFFTVVFVILGNRINKGKKRFANKEI